MVQIVVSNIILIGVRFFEYNGVVVNYHKLGFVVEMKRRQS